MNDYRNLDVPSTGPESSPSGGGNQGFTAAIIVLGLIFLLALALMAGYLFFLRPQMNAQRDAQGTQTVLIYAQNTATVMALTQQVALQAAGQKGPTRTPEVLPSATRRPTSDLPTSAILIPSETPIAALQVTNAPAVTAELHTATVAALLTQAATNGAILPTQPAASATQEIVQPTNTPVVQPTQAVLQPTQTNVVQPTQVVVQPTHTVVVQPTQGAAKPTQQAAQPTQVVAQATKTSVAPTQNLAQPTQTSVPATQIQPTQASSTATQSGSGVSVTTAPKPTALPTTGFADEFGIPGLLGLSLALLVVIVLVRRVRATEK
ncbi:MAG: hypothetical protein PHQ40_09490 [Anaerolineaceae bacterium]|nr:hypothetical protein [Anaerolineaceae bacterium]